MIKNFEAHEILPAGKVTPDDVVWGGADLAPDGRLQDQDPTICSPSLAARR